MPKKLIREKKIGVMDKPSKLILDDSLDVYFELKEALGNTIDDSGNKVEYFRATLWNIDSVSSKQDLIDWFEKHEHGYTTYSFDYFKSELERVKYTDKSLFELQFQLITPLKSNDFKKKLINLELWIQGEKGESTFPIPMPLEYRKYKKVTIYSEEEKKTFNLKKEKYESKI